ncbi:MAG TPA: hypothetical protein VF725_10905 [Ktedonobacterales bacterium]
MTSRLRVLLAALANTKAYRRAGRLSVILLVSALIVMIALYAGAAWALWLYWPTLLLISATFTADPLTLWILLGNLLNFARVPLDLARLERHYSVEPFTLALALRQALAAGDPALAALADDAMAPDAAAESERPLFASATLGADMLVVAVPAPLITSLVGPVVLDIFAALCLLMAGGGLLLAPAILNLPLGQVFTTRTGEIYLVAVCGGMLFLALLLLLQARRLGRRRRLQRQGMAIALDDVGLSFHHPVWRKRPRQIAWADARGLGRYTYKDTHTRERSVYLLESERETLLWEEPPTERYSAQPDREAIVARQLASWRLVAEITRRTRLPIRNISATLAALGGVGATHTSTTSAFLAEAYDVALEAKDVALATALWRVRRPHQRKLPRALRKLAAAAPHPIGDPLATPNALTTPASSPHMERFRARASAFLESHIKKQAETLRVARALIPYYPTEDASATPESFRRFLRRERRRRALGRNLGWSFALTLLVLLAGSGAFWYGERDISNLLATLPQQTAAQRPLYYAPLATPQADWMTQKSTKDDPSAAAFVHGGYQISSADPNSSAIFWIPRDQEGDVALAVTETIHGPATQDNYASGGIVFDVTGDGYAFSTFGVDEQGDWYLARYDSFVNFNDPWSYVDTGSDPAIHTGDNAVNHLLIVRHGPLYLLYVNSALVDRYYDSDHALPPGGDIGVYIDSGDITASFNDFAVYAVPPRLASIPVRPDLPGWLTF